MLVSTGIRAETVSFEGRSSNLVVPSSYDSASPAPLVLLLHGYGASGAIQDAYMGFSAIADEFGFLMLNPDGLVDPTGERFWNATDVCCNFFGSTVNDSDYLRGLIAETQEIYNINPDRIYITGHSNGGFMSYRMACDHADVVAAIASLAGATYNNLLACDPSEPVHVLQIHGTADDTILYDGTIVYPSAVGSVERWNAYNGCSGISDASAPPLDLDFSLVGSETSVVKYVDGCEANGSGELWTLQDGDHVPSLSAQYARSVIEYLLAHPKATVPPPKITLVNSVNDTGDSTLSEAEAVDVSVTHLLITFDQDIADPAGDSEGNDVTNPSNYLLYEDGGNNLFNTVSCSGGVDADDTQVTVNSVSYDAGTQTATLSVNSATALGGGSYRLRACSTLENSSGQALDGNSDGVAGDDFVRNFSVLDFDGDGILDGDDPDDDNDGLNDTTENGTPLLDPLDPDSDDDGIIDGLDRSPTSNTNNLCYGMGAIATLNMSISDNMTCAATHQIDAIAPAGVTNTGNLLLIAPKVNLGTGFHVNDSGQLKIIATDPTAQILPE